MSRSKQAPPEKTAAPMAAGVALHAMRRRVRLSRLTIWTLIAAGPIALGLSLTSTTTSPAIATAAPDPPANMVRTTAVGADPSGYAQLFVSAWLRSSADDATSAQARLAQSMAPRVALPDPVPAAQSAPVSVTTVRSAHRAQGAWSVTVAAQYADGRVRYYAVPVAADRAGTSFTVTGAPGVVAGPTRVEVPTSVYRVSVPEGELSSAVGEFLAAYLTGTGEVERYLAPGVQLTPVSPAVFTAVAVQQVSAVQDVAASERVPADGTQVRVRADVEARDADGRWPLAYELALTARAGRWEVSALNSGSAQRGGSR